MALVLVPEKQTKLQKLSSMLDAIQKESPLLCLIVNEEVVKIGDQIISDIASGTQTIVEVSPHREVSKLPNEWEWELNLIFNLV